MLTLTCTMEINVLCVLVIVAGWCLEQGLPLGAMVKVMDKGVAEPLVFTSLSMVGLHKKRAGKFMLVHNRKGIRERALLS